VIKAWVLALVSGLALVGCQEDQAAAGPLEFDLNRPFALDGEHYARMTGENLRIGREPTTVEFNTNPAPGLNGQTAKVGDYTIGLQSLDPYPETVDQPIALEDYRTTLLVRKA
jgi:hypothetical protein